MSTPKTMDEPDLNALLSESRELARQRPVMSKVHLVMPFFIAATLAVGLLVVGRLQVVASAVFVAFFTIGKLIIVSGAAPGIWGLSAVELALVVFSMDVLVGYFVTYNMHYLYRIPRMGPWLERLQSYCRYWLMKNPWMRRWALTAVALFVMFPLTGTGAPGGSLLGRLSGLRPRAALLGIVCGAGLGCGLMAVFAHQLEPLIHDIQHEWWFQTLGLVLFAILILVLLRIGQRVSRAAKEFAEQRASGGES